MCLYIATTVIIITSTHVAGPHFIEYLGYEVTPECCVVLKCKVSRSLRDLSASLSLVYLVVIASLCCVAFQVGNMKKETSAMWYKDGHQIKADEHLGFTEGVLKLEITQVRQLGNNPL